MSHRFVKLVASLLVLAALAAAAVAQPEKSPADLRTEIDILRQRIAQLEAQLTEAQRRAESLYEENQSLKKQLAERPTKGPEGEDAADQPLEIPIDRPLELEPLPEDWRSSPDALLAALTKSHDALLGEEPRQTRAQQQRYLSILSKWLRDAERDYRADVRWAVRITRVLERPTGEGDVLMQVVNPETGHAWGEPFTVTVKRVHREYLSANPSSHYWAIDGTLVAEPALNRERETPGFFLHPLLIGPFAEFEYSMIVRDLRPVTLERPKAEEEGVEEEGPSPEMPGTEGAAGAGGAEGAAHSSANSQTVTESR